MEKIITIELLGETFKFKADENRKNLEEILSHLTQEVRKVEEQFPVHALKTNKLAIVVMAALNISKQFVALTNNHSDFLNSVSSRTSKLGEMMRQSDYAGSADH